MATSCPRCGKQFRGFTVGTHVNLCPVTWQELFWNKVKKTATCWLWTGALEGKGYGHCRLSDGIDRRSHHVAWELRHGTRVPKGMELMHLCDVRNCVNPEHLKIGTHAENMADCKSKLRHAHGVRSRHAKLTEDQVRYIRANYRKTGPSSGNGSKIARELGVTPGMVHKIGRGESWKHVK